MSAGVSVPDGTGAGWWAGDSGGRFRRVLGGDYRLTRMADRRSVCIVSMADRRNTVRTLRGISVLAVLFFVASPCFALVVVESVSKWRAKYDLGVTIRTAIIGTNQAGVWLEFAPEGKLATFDSAHLEIKTGERTVVSKNLLPSKQTADRVVLYFSTDPAYLPTSEITLYVKVGNGLPPFAGFQFNIGDFIKDDDVTIRPAGAMTNAPDFRFPPHSKFQSNMSEFIKWDNSPFCVTNTTNLRFNPSTTTPLEKSR